MNSLIYLFQAGVLLIGLYAAFWFLLRKETFFQLNRFVLALIALAVVLLPLLPMPTIFPVIEVEFPAQAVPFIIDQPPAEVAPSHAFGSPTLEAKPQAIESNSISFGKILLFLYQIGLAFFVLRFVFQIGSICQLLARGKWIRESPLILVETTQKINPFSFFIFIVYNPSTLSSEDLEQIKAHEKVHSSQWHSLDIFIGELVRILLWFHPLAWKLARQIRLNLEYLADQVTLNKGFEKKRYQYSLLQVALKGKNLSLTNNFNQSLIKKRIIMMNAKQSPDYAKWKYFIMLPLLFAMFFCINQVNAQQATNSPKAKSESASKASVGKAQNGSSATATQRVGVANGAQATTGSGSNATGASTANGVRAQAQGSSSASGVSATAGEGGTAVNASGSLREDIYEGDGENIFFIVRSDVDKETLDGMVEGIAKAGIDVKIPNLDYDAQGQITRIKIEAKSNKGINGNVYRDNDGHPLEGPVGFYILERKGGQHFGTITGDPSNLRLPKGLIKFIEGATGYFKGDFIGE